MKGTRKMKDATITAKNFNSVSISAEVQTEEDGPGDVKDSLEQALAHAEEVADGEYETPEADYVERTTRPVSAKTATGVSQMVVASATFNYKKGKQAEIIEAIRASLHESGFTVKVKI
jgi:hypothetical protein